MEQDKPNLEQLVTPPVEQNISLEAIVGDDMPNLGLHARALLSFFQSLEPYTKIRATDVYDTVYPGVNKYSESAIKKVALSRFGLARAELLRTGLYEYFRKEGRSSATVYWIVDDLSKDREHMIPRPKSVERPQVKAKAADLQAQLDEVARPKLRGIYSEYLYRRLGEMGVGVLDLLLQSPGLKVSHLDILETLPTDPKTASETVLGVVQKMRSDTAISPHLRVTGSTAKSPYVANNYEISANLSKVLYETLSEIELELLTYLQGKSGRVPLYLLAQHLYGDNARDPKNIQEMYMSLHRLEAKYAHHLSVTKESNIAVASLRKYMFPEQFSEQQAG